ncbi:unnamed protein product, partial [marine sediment metagenome]
MSTIINYFRIVFCLGYCLAENWDVNLHVRAYFGIPILEAQACGLPVIGPNNSTIPELVQGHGWIFDICDDFPFVPVWIPTNQIYPAPSMSSLIETLEKVYN